MSPQPHARAGAARTIRGQGHRAHATLAASRPIRLDTDSWGVSAVPPWSAGARSIVRPHLTHPTPENAFKLSYETFGKSLGDTRIHDAYLERSDTGWPVEPEVAKTHGRLAAHHGYLKVRQIRAFELFGDAVPPLLNRLSIGSCVEGQARPTRRADDCLEVRTLVDKDWMPMILGDHLIRLRKGRAEQFNCGPGCWIRRNVARIYWNDPKVVVGHPRQSQRRAR